MFDADTETDEININKDFGTHISNIVTEEIKYRDAVNVTLVKKTAIDYVQQHSQ
jgi:citrate lyase gamma subunit